LHPVQKWSFWVLYQGKRQGRQAQRSGSELGKTKREGLLESRIGALIGLGGVAEDALASEDLSTGFVGGPQGGGWHQDDLDLLFTHK
ncbi:hypothetical protein LRB11_17495, partial [Ectothiorhodospira haloalkaliphila]|uniref:hypothetical protein n=1 Tax=Ectothiorhodospira haloalkaliphila TaxID=421628 RepID=UPI001EE86D4D